MACAFRRDEGRQVFRPSRRAWRIVRDRQGQPDSQIPVGSRRWTEPPGLQGGSGHPGGADSRGRMGRAG